MASNISYPSKTPHGYKESYSSEVSTEANGDWWAPFLNFLKYNQPPDNPRRGKIRQRITRFLALKYVLQQ